MIDNFFNLLWMLWMARYGVPPDFMYEKLMLSRHVANQFVYTRILPRVQ